MAAPNAPMVCSEEMPCMYVLERKSMSQLPDPTPPTESQPENQENRPMKVCLGFMCSVDFHHEMGEALGGTTVYASLKDLNRNRKCIDECGSEEVVTLSLLDFNRLLEMANFDSSKFITSAVGEVIWSKKGEENNEQ
jgi:hypothetical protein